MAQRDRTATSRTFTLGASRPLTEKLQISGDVTLPNLSGTESSGGVDAIPGTGNEWFYTAQLIGSNLITTGDISVLGLRYIDGDTYNSIGASLNTRYPLNSAWRVNPRVQLDLRHNTDSR